MVVQILYADNQLANDSCAERHVLVGIGAHLLGINWRNDSLPLKGIKLSSIENWQHIVYF